MPFYHNFVTKETTWDIPEEYQSYLGEYQLYLQRKNDKPENSDCDEKNKPILILPEGNARKRRRIKRAFMRAIGTKTISENNFSETPIEFLSEYIAYSNSPSSSSSTAEEESSELLNSPSRVTTEEPTEMNQSTLNSPVAFIGPRLPSPSPEFHQQPISINLDQITRLILDKFALIDPEQDKLSHLQVLYIQFVVSFLWFLCLSEFWVY